MSFISWTANNGGESGTDFQMIARDTNFRFNTHKGRVNWGQIEKLSIERLIEEHNVSQLGHNIHNVVNLDIESEFDVRILNSNFVKIFKLSQLTNDFLLHCKRHLSQQRFLLKADLDKVSRKLTQAKKENLELKKIIHWNKLRPGLSHNETPSTAEAVMCDVCGKLFKFESYLIMHYNRRHPDIDYAMQKTDNFLHNYDKEPGECGGSTSITGGGRGEGGGGGVGYRPSRDGRYTAELESLRNLINSKLGSSKSVQTMDVPSNGGVVTSNNNTGVVNTTNTRINTSKPGTSGSALTMDVFSNGNVPKSGETSVHPMDERDVNQWFGRVNQKMYGRDDTSRVGEVAKTDEEENSSKISKEQYEKHLSTMENAWRKQFQELDKKYQNEIKKLQEELKATMEQNKRTCQILILEKDHKNSKESKRDGKPINFESELIRQRTTKVNLTIDEPSTSTSITHKKSERNGDDTNKEIYDLETNKYALLDNTSTLRKEVKTLETVKELSRKDQIKYPNGCEKFNHWRMIRDELNKITEDKRKRDEQKYEELKQSLSPKDIIWSGTGSTVSGDLTKPKTLCRQQSIYDFIRPNNELFVDTKCEQNRVENETNVIKDNIIDTQSVDVNKNENCDIDEPVRLKKIEQANVHRNNIEETVQVQKENDEKIFRKQISSSDSSNDVRVPNYQNFLEYLNQNDEITKEQLKESHQGTSLNKKEAKVSFFKDMNTNIFDFKRGVTKKNGLFFNEDFQRDVSNLVAINPTSMEKILDKTFRISDKPLRYDPDRIRKAVGDKADSEALRNAHERLTSMEAILNDIDNEKQTNGPVGKSKQSNIIPVNPNLKKDALLSSSLKKDSEDTQSRQVMPRKQDISTNSPIKRSAKYFKDISDKSNETPSILFTNSSAEAIDKLITVINPNSEFDLEAIDLSSESSKSEAHDEVEPIIQVVALLDATDTHDDSSGGKQITVTRAEYEILAKDLSTIVEETESEDWPTSPVATNWKSPASVATEKKVLGMIGNLNSDDSNTLTESKEIPANGEDTKDKASSNPSTVRNEVDNLDEIVDGKRRVDLVYWNGEVCKNSDSFEERNLDQKVTGILATYKAPVKVASKMDFHNETKEQSTKEDTLTNERQEDLKSKKKEKLKIKVVLKERLDDKITNEEIVKQRKMDHMRRTGEVLEIKADIEDNNKESLAIKKDLEKRIDLAIRDDEKESQKEKLTNTAVIDKPKSMYEDLNENEEDILPNNDDNYGNLNANEDILPKIGDNESMYADLNERLDEDRLAVKDDVMDQFERVMKSLNLNPEWTRLPDKTFQQKLKIIEHDRLLKRKINKHINENIKSKVDSILNEKLKRNDTLRTLKYRDTNKTGHDEKNDRNIKRDADKNADSHIDDLKKQPIVSRIKVLEKSQKSPNIRELLNKKITDILRKDIKSSSEENNERKSDTKHEEHEGIKSPPTDYILIDTPVFDLNAISNITRNLTSTKASETSEWETMNSISSSSSSSSSEELNKKKRENQTSKARGNFNQTTSQSRSSSKPNNIEDDKSRSSKQTFESRLTKNMYNNIKTDVNDILDREHDYLKTNNFTSQQKIGRSHSRGYNFFSKSKQTPADKLSSTKSKSSDNLKSPQLTDTDDNLGKRDVHSQPSSMKESSENTSKTNSSKASSILDDRNKPKETSEDLFVIKSPYNLFTASESNFLVKQYRKQPIEPEVKERNSKEDKHTSYGYSSQSRLDRGDVPSKSLSTGSIKKDTTNDVNVTSGNLFTGKNSNAKTEDNVSTKSNNAYVVPNKRDSHQNTQIAGPLRGDGSLPGTIRSIAKTIQDGEDSTSSFELDDFLEKNNIG